MSHEPENEDPIHHNGSQTPQTEGRKTLRELLPLSIISEQVGFDARQLVFFFELVAHISVMFINPVSSRIQIFLHEPFGRKCYSKRVIDTSHAILLKSTQYR